MLIDIDYKIIKKVVIIKCSSEYSWYNNKIGKIFNVYENIIYDGEKIFMLIDEIHFISYDDCVDLLELRKRKLNRILYN